MKAGEDFHLAFSPEREDPGNPSSVVATIPKVVGGFSPECLRKAIELYSVAIKTLVPVSSCRVAEATKLLENTFRSVNIALVNELKIVYAAMGIDVWEVINAAKTKPFGFMAFYPGPGLGGHCIPIDPFYLTWKAREFGQTTRFIELAGEINTAMPEWVVQKIAEALNEHRKSVNGSRILVLGLSYKANVDDDRESPSYVLMEKLKQRGAEVAYHDPYIETVRDDDNHELVASNGDTAPRLRHSVPFTPLELSSADVVVIVTDHTSIDYQMLVDHASVVVDTRNATAGTRPGKATIVSLSNEVQVRHTLAQHKRHSGPLALAHEHS